jgi:tripartite-type tricarboxylate transporter receptor subunit TctC
MAESGFPELTSGSWQGVFVPAGTPKEVVDKLYSVLMDTMKTPEVVQRLGNGGVDVVTSARANSPSSCRARPTAGAKR